MDLAADSLKLTIGNLTICQNFNINFQAGQFWGILGINGAGKTTLLHTLNGLISPQKGQVYLQGQNIRDLPGKIVAQQIALLLQEYEFNFSCSVMEAALIGRHPHLQNWQWEDEQDQQIALQALADTGISHLQHRQTDTLSGGEKRRLNIASVLTQDPSIFLLDEPTNHLDVKAQLEMLTLFKTLVLERRKTVIMVIHDPNLAVRYCDHVLLLMGQGQTLSGITEETMNSTNLSRLYQCRIKKISSDGHEFYFPV